MTAADTALQLAALLPALWTPQKKILRKIVEVLLPRSGWPGDRTRLYEVRANVPKLGKEARVQGLLQECDAGTSARATRETDDPVNGLHVAKAPELESAFDVHEFFTHLVSIPVCARVAVDAFKDCNQPVVLFVRQGDGQESPESSLPPRR